MKNIIEIYSFQLVMQNSQKKKEKSLDEDVSIDELIDRIFTDDCGIDKKNEENENETSMLFKS